MGRHDPATEKQKKYARSLGVKFSEGITQEAISALIQAAKSKSRPTAAQLKFAKDLGISVKSDTSASDLTGLIRDEVEKQSREVMRSNPYLRAGKMIRYEGCIYRISFIGKRGRDKWVADLVPVYGGRRKPGVMVLKLKNAQSVSHTS